MPVNVIVAPVRLRRALEASVLQPRKVAGEWVAPVVCGLIVALLALGQIDLPERLAMLVLPSLVLLVLAVVLRNLRRVLLAIPLLDIPLQFDVNLGYRDDVARLGGLSGFNVSVTTGALILLYALWMSELLSRREHARWRPVFGTALPAILYLAVLVVSLAVAQVVTLGAAEVFMVAQIFLLYLYIINTVRKRDDILFVVTILLVGLLFESVFILAQRYVGPGFHLPGITNRIDTGLKASGVSTRLGGTVGAPNTAASYIALLLAPALGLLCAPIARRYKLLAGTAFVLGLTALIDTFSRGGWLAFALSMIVFCGIALRRRWLSPIIPVGAAVLVTAALLTTALPFQREVADRLTSNDYGSAHSRLALARMAERMIGDHPVFGVGANNYSVALAQYETPEVAAEWHYTVHDKYLLVWAETGIIGLLAFLGFLGSTIGRGAHAVAGGDRLTGPLALGLMAGFVGQLAHMAVDLFHNRVQVESLWVAAALLTVLWLRTREEAAFALDERTVRAPERPILEGGAA